MPLCQLILLEGKKLPASQLQFLDDIFNFFLQARLFGKVYILIFWAQKHWFIELNLSLGSDVVCQPVLMVSQREERMV